MAKTRKPGLNPTKPIVANRQQTIVLNYEIVVTKQLYGAIIAKYHIESIDDTKGISFRDYYNYLLNGANYDYPPFVTYQFYTDEYITSAYPDPYSGDLFTGSLRKAGTYTRKEDLVEAIDWTLRREWALYCIRHNLPCYVEDWRPNDFLPDEEVLLSFLKPDPEPVRSDTSEETTTNAYVKGRDKVEYYV